GGRRGRGLVPLRAGRRDDPRADACDRRWLVAPRGLMEDRQRSPQRGGCDRGSGRLQGFAPPRAGIEPRDSASAESRLAKHALVLDWDGTVTERDGLHMAIERFGDLGVFDALEDELGTTLTLHEVIAAEMATIRAPFEEVRDWLVEHVRVRAGFRELVAEQDPLIVSSGFRELIEP